MASTEPVFALEDVSIRLGGRLVIDRLSWELLPGEVAVVVGPSGSGKSVFLSLLLGFLKPDSGRVARPADPGAGLFRQVSVLFQEDALMDDRTVEANLAMALLERPDVFGGPFPPEISSRIDAALRDVALSPDRVREQLPSRLSGGMRRRVALARALIRRPRTLIADEPTSGLDPETSRAIFELMQRLIETNSMSALIITHDPVCAELLGRPLYRFTPHARRLEILEPGVPATSPGEEMEADGAMPPSLPEEGAPGSPINDLNAAGFVAGLAGAVDRLGEAVLSLRWLASTPNPGLLLQDLRTWGIRSAGLVVLIFLIMGLVVEVQAERAVVELGFSNRLPELFALAVTRSAPLIVCVLLAGRCGTAVAAQTGWRVLTSQYRALETLGIKPEQSFFPSLFWSWIIAAPLLLGLGLGAASLSGFVYLASPLSRALITPTFFLNQLPPFLDRITVIGMLLKVTAMAGGASVIAYRCGAGEKWSSSEVMEQMTRALVFSFIWLAMIDLALGLVAGF